MRRSLGEGVQHQSPNDLSNKKSKSSFAKATEDKRGLAQLARASRLVVRKVKGSTEKKIKTGGLAQLARAPALHAGGQGFDSLILHISCSG